jgi:hypothetical protein
LCSSLSSGSLRQQRRHRGRHEHRGPRARDDADEQCEREALKYRPTEKVQRQHRGQRCAGCDDRTPEGVGNGRIDCRADCPTSHRPQPLAHAVKDHDRVVDRVARDGEQRGHHVEVELVAGEAQCRHRDYQVVRGGNGRAGRKARAEAYREIGRDPG